MKREARQFRAHTIAGEALALDPGGGGLLAAAIRGRQPSPGAFGFWWFAAPELAFDPEKVDEGIAVLSIGGPLEHHSGWWCNYEDIARVSREALQHESVTALVHRIDSPGGVVAGCDEAARELRLVQKQTGKPIYAYVDEMACSAAMWLASSAAEIWLPRTAQVGSIGVILCTVDESKAWEKMGVKIRYVVSGARKADMHPGNPVTDEVLNVAQSKVDYLAQLFFRSVAKSRGLSPAKVQGFQAAVFHGENAVKAGLADGVSSWAKFLSTVKRASGATVGSDRATPSQGAAQPGKGIANEKGEEAEAGPGARGSSRRAQGSAGSGPEKPVGSEHQTA